MRKKKKKKKKELMVLGSQYSSIAGLQRQIYVQSTEREKREDVKRECSEKDKDKRKVMSGKKEKEKEKGTDGIG